MILKCHEGLCWSYFVDISRSKRQFYFCSDNTHVVDFSICPCISPKIKVAQCFQAASSSTELHCSVNFFFLKITRISLVQLVPIISCPFLVHIWQMHDSAFSITTHPEPPDWQIYLSTCMGTSCSRPPTSVNVLFVLGLLYWECHTGHRPQMCSHQRSASLRLQAVLWPRLHIRYPLHKDIMLIVLQPAVLWDPASFFWCWE